MATYILTDNGKKTEIKTKDCIIVSGMENFIGEHIWELVRLCVYNEHLGIEKIRESIDNNNLPCTNQAVEHYS